MTYIDTSVLVAYYCPETLSSKAQKVLRGKGDFAISSLVETELISALVQKVRSREMPLDAARRVYDMFLDHLRRGAYHRLALEQSHFARAQEWLASFQVHLRTLDALHVAIASLERATLLTADAALAKACRNLDIATRLIS
ncbi:MAG TPA: type II toxin-antitoxin system VapC family toxin [Terriglobia bacterium]|nr:type II toxin-antitoxin system VapC family toxin [Terriglobia bacterium]